MRFVAQYGYLEIAKWLHAHVDRSILWSPDAFFLAVNAARLDFAKWLYENDGHTCIARSNDAQHVELTSGDTSTLFDLSRATCSGRFALVDWLLQCAGV